MAAVSAGVVYLLHLDPPGLGHARHELGQGARLLEIAHAVGIGWMLACTWHGSRGPGTPAKTAGRSVEALPLCGVTPRRFR
jgi:hypothetical protein